MSEQTEVEVSSQPRNISNALVGCLLAVAAGMATWGVLQAKHPFFTNDKKIEMNEPVENQLAYLATQARVDGLNAAVVLAIGGALLSGALAFVAHGCCSLPMRLLVALPWGAIWGAATGFVGVMAYSAIMPKDELPSATNTGLAQAVAFAMLGAGLGLLYGAFTRIGLKTVTSGITGALAGAVGAFAFPIVTGLIVPNQSIVELLPAASTVRALWLGLPFAAIGLAVPAFGNR